MATTDRTLPHTYLPVRHQRGTPDIPTRRCPFYIDQHHLDHWIIGAPDGNMPHVHAGLEIGAVVKGEAQLYYDGSFSELGEDDCFLTDAMIPHCIGTRRRGCCEFSYAHLSSDLIIAMPPAEQSTELLRLFHAHRPGCPPVYFARPAVVQHLETARRLFHSRERFGLAEAWAQLFVAIVALLRESDIQPNARTSIVHRKQHPVVLRALEFIHSDLGSALSLDEIAANCSISPSRLSHVFRDSMNCSPIDYRNKVRIERAIASLLSSDIKVERIAAECGFESLSHFYRLFKRITGHRPSNSRPDRSLPA